VTTKIITLKKLEVLRFPKIKYYIWPPCQRFQFQGGKIKKGKTLYSNSTAGKYFLKKLPAFR